ncbi:MAG: hypothetical protein KH194_08070 [Clostridiales bacterium]|nr:hypothetical protein [Clostridiales bacterium]
MKKRVCSILLAAVLCVTMLSVVALATECADGAHTYDENLWAPNANGISHSPRCDKCEHVRENLTIQHYDINRDGICDACRVGLGAYLGNSPAQGGCFTTLQGALDYAGNERDSITVNPIRNQESVTYSGKNTQVTLNLAGVTINELKVTSGKLTITGNGRVTKLEVSGDTVQLSGGTYENITGVTDKNTLLAHGYVFDGNTVKEAPIKSVTASVMAHHNNAKYGYTAEQAPVLTAAITPDNVTGVTYRWYKVNGSKKTAIVNATAQTYTVETGLNAGDYDYCCTATVGTYSLTSGDVTVTIKKADGPQLGTINVNQVYNDTASKTINIYDYIGTDLNKLAKDAGTLRFHTGTYSPVDTIKSGWGVDVNTGAITYQLANGLSVNNEITITMQVGYNDQTYSKNHEDATVTVNITLTKITPTGTPNYTPITSSGKTLADAHLNADNAFSVPGTVKWVGETDELDPSTVPVEKDKAYTWKFTPLLDNYESITGSIILWTESGSGVVIIVPSQSGESTPASNPNTGAAHVGQPLPGLALLALAALCLYAGTRRF